MFDYLSDAAEWVAEEDAYEIKETGDGRRYKQRKQGR